MSELVPDRFFLFVLGNWTASNILCLIGVYGKYVLADHLDEERLMVWCELLNLIEMMCRPKLKLREIKELGKITKYVMSRFEQTVPATEHTTVYHQLLHIPLQIANWGPVRSWWAFPSERLCGTLANMKQSNAYTEAHLMEVARALMTLPSSMNDHQMTTLVDEARFTTTIQFPLKSNQNVEIQTNPLYLLLQAVNSEFSNIYTKFIENNVLRHQRKQSKFTFNMYVEKFFNQSMFINIPSQAGNSMF